MTPLLSIEGLSVRLWIDDERRPVVDDVSFQIGAGEAVGLVGESGSGKSMTARSVLRILPPGAETGGRVLFDGADVLTMGRDDLRALRTDGAAMIFQDPAAHVNPVRRIGDFLTEALRTNRGVDKATAWKRATEKLAEVGIDDGEARMRQFPHELSGGMLQRVMIASVLLLEPRLILADEPTTALDVTTQAEVMAILDELRRDYGMAMLFITHDLELAAATCDRTVVMYSGTVVEQQASRALETAPRHPYTAGLMASRPSLDANVERLVTIPGRAVAAYEAPSGCPFAPRCAYVEPICEQRRPPLEAIGDGLVRCVRAAEIREQVAAIAASTEAA